MSQFRFVFAIFCITGILIFAVYLRNATNRLSYNIHAVSAEQNRLRQELWQKQLQLESLTNPAAVYERLEDQ